MNKKWILGAAIAGGLLVVAVGIVLLFGGRGQKKGNENFHPENWDAPIPSAKADIEEAFSMFDSQEQPTYDELMKGMRSGKINFVWELWRLRRGCPEKMERLQCNMRILTYLKEKYPGVDGEKLAQLVRQYLKYEDIMLGFMWPEGISTKERYDLMKAKRREALSNEEAALVFGMEETSMELGEKQAAFFKDTAGMPGDQRIKQYDELVKKTMGAYYQAFMEDQPSFNRYETEMSLRDADLAKVGSAEQSAMTQAVRERYFGKDGAARMAAVEKELAAGEESTKKYEDAEAKFLKDNPSLSPDQREAALADLRVKFMGREEAQAYARRKQYEDAMKKMNVTP